MSTEPVDTAIRAGDLVVCVARGGNVMIGVGATYRALDVDARWGGSVTVETPAGRKVYPADYFIRAAPSHVTLGRGQDEH